MRARSIQSEKAVRMEMRIGAYLAGATLRQVADDFGVTHCAIYDQLRRAGIICRAPGNARAPVFPIVYMRAHGVKIREIADHFGMAFADVAQRLQRIGAWDTRALLDLTAFQLEAYRRAIDTDFLDHADALEIASEYRREVAA